MYIHIYIYIHICVCMSVWVPALGHPYLYLFTNNNLNHIVNLPLFFEFRIFIISILGFEGNLPWDLPKTRLGVIYVYFLRLR